MTIDLDKMTPIVEPQVKAKGLSPSSFQEFSSCQRKWFLRKVAKVPIDTDASEDYAAFNIGKAFHKCLEDTKHDLTGLTYSQVKLTSLDFGIECDDDVAMIYAMLSKYKQLHAKVPLEVVGCEVIIDVPEFYGITDVVMYEDGVGLWIVDIKTAATFQSSLLNTLTSHPQLALYARYFDVVAHAVGMKAIPFAGVRLRTTTKSKLTRKEGESTTDFIARMAKGIKSSDIAVPAELLNIAAISEQHQLVYSKISDAKVEDEKKFAPNYGNCMSYFRPCNYYSRCHGKNYTNAPKLEMVEV